VGVLTYSSLPPSLLQALRPLLLHFPLQTFTANVLGSFLSSLLAVLAPMAKERGEHEAAHLMGAIR